MRMKRRLPVAIRGLSLTLLIAVAQTAQAASGDLDPRFGAGPGYTAVGFAQTVTQGYDVVAAAGGGWYATGVTFATPPGAQPSLPLLARFRADGTPDVGFGVDGIVLGPPLADALISYGVLLRDAQRLYQVLLDDRRYYVVAYRLDGSIDAAYGNGGIATIESGLDDLVGRHGAALHQGGVLVAGAGAPAGSTQRHFLLAKLTPTGTPDAGFAGGGRAFYAIGGSNEFTDISVQPGDGKLLAAGRAVLSPGPYRRMVVARFMPDGTPDSGFGSAGFADLDLLSGSDLGRRAHALPDGRIVVAGTSCAVPDPTGTQACFAGAARLLPNGTLDASFGDGGKVAYAVDGDRYTAMFAMTVDKSGRVVIGGQSFATPFDGGEGYLLRLLAGGQLDPTFGDAGIARIAETSNVLGVVNTEVFPPSGAALKRLTTIGYVNASEMAPKDAPPASLLIARHLDGD